MIESLSASSQEFIAFFGGHSGGYFFRPVPGADGEKGAATFSWAAAYTLQQRSYVLYALSHRCGLSGCGRSGAEGAAAPSALVWSELVPWSLGGAGASGRRSGAGGHPKGRMATMQRVHLILLKKINRQTSERLPIFYVRCLFLLFGLFWHPCG